MPKARYADTVIAESDRCEVVEGNQYFPPDSVRFEHLRPSATTTICPWKGTANYYDVVVGDTVLADAAWVYRSPKPKAANIKDHLAFWKGVRVDV